MQLKNHNRVVFVNFFRPFCFEHEQEYAILDKLHVACNET